MKTEMLPNVYLVTLGFKVKCDLKEESPLSFITLTSHFKITLH